MRHLRGATVVVTGASSGIGRAAAIEFAKEGANLVIAARGTEALEDVKRECEAIGAQVVVQPTDVTDARAVETLAQVAAGSFNDGIDVWLNDPGIGAIGAYDQVPIEVHDRVVSTNLLGYMHGAHAVLPYFKRQRSGVLINMNSLGAFLPSPYAAAYTASKFGLRGFTEALRGELRNYRDVHVCDVFPGFVDSPGVGHGANYTGAEVKPGPPAVSTWKVARTIVSLARRPRPTKILGASAHVSKLMYAIAPTLAVNGLARFMENHFEKADRVPISDGILFSPSPRDSGVKGHYPTKSRAPLIVAAFGVAAAILAGWCLQSALVDPRTRS